MFLLFALPLLDSLLRSCHSSLLLRGVARILQRGFPLVVDPRRGGLGAAPPEADEKSILIRSNIMMFAYLPIYLPTVSQVAKYMFSNSSLATA